MARMNIQERNGSIGMLQAGQLLRRVSLCVLLFTLLLFNVVRVCEFDF